MSLDGRNPPKRSWVEQDGILNHKDMEGPVEQTTAYLWQVCCQYGCEAQLVCQVILQREINVGIRIRTLHHMLIRGHRVRVADDEFSALEVDDKRWDWSTLDHVSNFRM